uniref:Uncharacterized protein n=1 Tax=Schistocephalus solidus TaxID=70667 RepID=A0A0X3P2K4_SCHSO
MVNLLEAFPRPSEAAYVSRMHFRRRKLSQDRFSSTFRYLFLPARSLPTTRSFVIPVFPKRTPGNHVPMIRSNGSNTCRFRTSVLLPDYLPWKFTQEPAHLPAAASSSVQYRP